MRNLVIVTAFAVASFLGPAVQAAGTGGCESFDFPLATELEWMQRPDSESVKSGATLPHAPAKAMTVALAAPGDVQFAVAPDGKAKGGDGTFAGVVTIDGNDKDDPSAIPSFVDAMASGVDFVQGSRFIPGGVAENTPLLRYLAIRGLHAPLLRIASGFPWTDTTQGFRGYSRRLLGHPGLSLFRDVFDSYELLAHVSARAPRLGLRCLELPTARRYPKGEVPTKISALRGNARVLRILFAACTGAYDPR